MATQKMIKKDAKMSVEIGTLLLENLNEIFLYLINEHTEEELQHYKSLVENDKPLEEPWMNHLQSLQLLISEFERSAVESGQTYEADVDSNTTRQDN